MLRLSMNVTVCGWIAVLLGALASPGAAAVYDAEVFHLQMTLDTAGQDPGAVDGLWGRNTMQALKRYQRRHGLKTTGQLNDATRKSLGLTELPRDSKTREQRVALVVGNAAYAPGALRSPVNDARAMADTLRRLGFAVTMATDVDQVGLDRSFANFAARLQPGGVALFYFAGYGVQYKGRNYLLPVGAGIPDPADIPARTLSLGAVLQRLSRARSLATLVILDACRHAPIPGVSRAGLAAVDVPDHALVALAAEPDQVVDEGRREIGYYAGSLATQLIRGGTDVEEIFNKVAQTVRTASRSQQTPWFKSGLKGTYYLLAEGEQPAPLVQPITLQAPAEAVPQPSTEPAAETARPITVAPIRTAPEEPPGSPGADAKVGFIAIPRLLNETEPGRQAQARYERLRADIEAEIAAARDDLAASRIASDEFNQRVETAEQRMALSDRELTAEVLVQAENALRRVARTRGYALVVKDPKVIAYLDPRRDVTDAVIATMADPAAVPPASAEVLQDRLGYVDVQRVVQRTSIGRDARERFERLKQDKQAALDAGRADLEAGRIDQQSYEQLVSDIEKELVRADRDLLDEVLFQADKVLRRIAREERYSLIFKTPRVLGYLAPAADISDKVIAGLEEAE